MTAVPARREEIPPIEVGEEVLRTLGLNPRDPSTQALVLVCERYGLDPLLGHVRLIGQRGEMVVYLTRDGMIEVAHRSGHLDGIVVDEQRRNSTGDGWTAYVSVWRDDMTHPFRYGAQCKDTELQAKLGNGPEMALARAERRALKRAFRIPTADVVLDDDVPADPVRVDAPGPAAAVDAPARTDSSVGAELGDAGDDEERDPARSSSSRVPSSVVDSRMQADAHRIVGLWDEHSREQFLEVFAIARFVEPWPDAAVLAALEQGVNGDG